MTSVDLAVLGVMILSGLLAFSRGLVREVLSIGAWVGALVVALSGIRFLLPIVTGWIADPFWAQIGSYAILFLVSLIIFSVIAKAIGNAVRSSAVSGVDRSLGLLFGLARGAALAMIAYFFACLAIPPDRWPQPVLESRSLPYIYTGAAWVVRQIPEPYRPQIPSPPPPSRQTALGGLLKASPIGRASDPPLSK